MCAPSAVPHSAFMWRDPINCVPYVCAPPLLSSPPSGAVCGIVAVCRFFFLSCFVIGVIALFWGFFFFFFGSLLSFKLISEPHSLDVGADSHFQQFLSGDEVSAFAFLSWWHWPLLSCCIWSEVAAVLLQCWCITTLHPHKGQKISLCRKSELSSCTWKHIFWNNNNIKNRLLSLVRLDLLDWFALLRTLPPHWAQPFPPFGANSNTWLPMRIAKRFPPHRRPPYHCQMFKSNMQLQCIDNPRGGITGCFGTGAVRGLHASHRGPFQRALL